MAGGDQLRRRPAAVGQRIGPLDGEEQRRGRGPVQHVVAPGVAEGFGEAGAAPGLEDQRQQRGVLGHGGDRGGELLALLLQPHVVGPQPSAVGQRGDRQRHLGPARQRGRCAEQEAHPEEGEEPGVEQPPVAAEEREAEDREEEERHHRPGEVGNGAAALTPGEQHHQPQRQQRRGLQPAEGGRALDPEMAEGEPRIVELHPGGGEKRAAGGLEEVGDGGGQGEGDRRQQRADRGQRPADPLPRRGAGDRPERHQASGEGDREGMRVPGGEGDRDLGQDQRRLAVGPFGPPVVEGEDRPGAGEAEREVEEPGGDEEVVHQRPPQEGDGGHPSRAADGPSQPGQRGRGGGEHPGEEEPGGAHQAQRPTEEVQAQGERGVGAEVSVRPQRRVVGQVLGDEGAGQVVGEILERRRRAEEERGGGEDEEPEHCRQQRDRTPSPLADVHRAMDFGDRSPLAAEENSSLTMYSGRRLTSS